VTGFEFEPPLSPALGFEVSVVAGASGLPLVVRTPVKAPGANAFAERFVGTVRRECLDRMLIFSRRHLVVVVHEYFEHYNRHRPHRSLGQRPPQPNDASPAVLKKVDPSRLRRSDRIGGLIHEYHLVA
jgi:hypothetical protein